MSLAGEGGDTCGRQRPQTQSFGDKVPRRPRQPGHIRELMEVSWAGQSQGRGLGQSRSQLSVSGWPEPPVTGGKGVLSPPTVPCPTWLICTLGANCQALRSIRVSNQPQEVLRTVPPSAQPCPSQASGQLSR